jgi:integrase
MGTLGSETLGPNNQEEITMPKMRLTQRGIENLKHTGKWINDYWDEELPGFCLRVHPSGRKAFCVRYTGDNGKRRRIHIGRFPPLSLAEAREHAKVIIGRIARGEDPQAERVADKESITLEELAAEYLELHAKRKKESWCEDARILRVDLLPAWGNRRAKTIGRREVGELLDGIVDRGAPIMANRVKALISKMYNFGMGRDLVAFNPCHGVSLPSKPRQRDRVLDAEEIPRLWRALGELDPVLAGTYQLRLLTAQRGVEVSRLRWDQLRGSWWTIPSSVTKNGLSHRVPLSAQVQSLLSGLRCLSSDSAWVFPSPVHCGSPLKSFSRASRRLARAAGLADFTAHDLRRTAASHMTSLGVPRLVVSKILNHVESGVTSVYDRHSYDLEKRSALDLWGSRVEEILCAAGGVG